MNHLFTEYPYPFQGKLDAFISNNLQSTKDYCTENGLKQAFSFIDLTSLNATDTEAEIEKMTQKVNDFSLHYPKMPTVAAICVYPALVENVRKTLRIENIQIASVVGTFPASQSFIEVKELETKMAADKGADEADMVISIGSFLTEDYQKVFDEIKALKTVLQDKHLKVIIESGVLADPELIWKASIIAMEAGADFIKTSTGKMPVSATLEAATVMLAAINAYYKKTGKQIGFKPAGGIRTCEDACQYMSLVKNILGDKWLTPEWFRIGASSLANNLLAEIKNLASGNKSEVNYF